MDLSGILASARRHFIALVALGVAAFSLAYAYLALQGDYYEAEALVDLSPVYVDEEEPSTPQQADRFLANQLVIARGTTVAGAAARDLSVTDIDRLRSVMRIE